MDRLEKLRFMIAVLALASAFFAGRLTAPATIAADRVEELEQELAQAQLEIDLLRWRE